MTPSPPAPASTACRLSISRSFDLYSKQLITLDEALARASNPDEFKLRIQGIRSASDSAREEMASQMADFERFARK